ncbi:MAG: DUF4123 domain-containing protein [Bryobacteraceae bacterium]|jgi:hypothetical protein
MRLTLKILSGPAAGRKLALQPQQSVTIGRTRPANLAIPDDSLLSGAHFRIICQPKGWTLEDLNSCNGTLLNGRKISRAPLADGDRISAGEALVEISIESTTSGTAQPLVNLLRRQGPLFAVLDAARDRSIVELLEDDLDCEYQCLYDGKSATDLAAWAPYLVSLSPESPLLNVLVERGWGQSWGVYLTSAKSLEEVRRHLRHFLIVTMANGKEGYFRFYDPRVLRVYLPACTPEEAKAFFGPIDAYLMEAEKPQQLLRFNPGAHECERQAIAVKCAAD